MVQQACVMCRLMAEVKIMPIVESLNDFGCLTEDFYQDLKKSSVSKRIKWRGLLRKINSNQQKLARMIFVQLIQRVNPEIAKELEKITQICCVCGLIGNPTAGDPRDDQDKFLSLQFPKTTHTWEPLRRSKSLDILIEYSCSSVDGKPSEKLQSQADQSTGYIKAIYQRSGFRYEDSKKGSHGKQSSQASEYHREQLNPSNNSFRKEVSVDSEETSPMEVQKNEDSNEDRISNNDGDDDDNDDVDIADADADIVVEEGCDDAPEVLFKSDIVESTSEGPDGASIGQLSVDSGSFLLEKTPTIYGQIINDGVEGVSHNPVGGVYGLDDVQVSEDLASQGTTHGQIINDGVEGVSHNPVGEVCGPDDVQVSEDLASQGTIHGQIVNDDVEEVSHNPVGEVSGPDDVQVSVTENRVSQSTNMGYTKQAGGPTTKTTPAHSQPMLPIPPTWLVWVVLVLLVLTVFVVVTHMLPTGLLFAIVVLACIQIYISRNG